MTNFELYSTIKQETVVKAFAHYLESEEQILSAFFKLNNVNFYGKSFNEISKIYFDHLSVLPDIVMPNFYDKPQPFFRSFRCDTIPTEISRFCYPPKDLTKLGRLNIDGFPVLYTSDKPLISVLEVDAKPGEIIFTGIWYAKSFYNRLLNIFMINYEGQNVIHIDERKLLFDTFNKLPGETKTRYTLLHRLVTELILGNNYPLSSFFGHYYFYVPRPYTTDIMIYPSIKGKRQHVNFAFNKNMVDESFYFGGATMMKVLEINEKEEYGKFLLLKQTISDEGRIKWLEENKEILLTVGP